MNDMDCSVENAFSRKMFEINKQFLCCQKALYEANKKKLSIANIKVLFSYLKSGAFSRITRRLRMKTNNPSDDYPLNSYGSFPRCKVVVYTCIWGGYDDTLEPLFVNSDIEYRIITDKDVPSSSAWKKHELPSDLGVSQMSATEVNRFCKMKPHVLFPEFDYSIYIDGNVRIITDLMPLIADIKDSHLAIHEYQTNCIYNMKNAIIAGGRAKRKNVESQIKKYKKDGFPKNFGAFECNVLIRKHNEKDCAMLMDKWWDEFCATPSKRDQLSLPYVLWKNGLTSEFVCSLGSDVRLNPRFQVLSKHNK